MAKDKSQRASYSAAADAVQKKLDAVRDGMPELKELTAPVKGKKNSAGGVVSDKFIEAIAAQASRDPEFANATGVDPDRLRNGNRFAVAFAPLATSLLELGQEVTQLVLETRKRNSGEARSAYAWMQWKGTHGKDPRYGKLARKLGKLMKASGKGGGKGKRSRAASAQKVTQTVTETVTEKKPAS